MFTISQIRQAHAKVKSGADFPSYVQEMKQLGVIAYEHYLTDGHVNYRGHDNFAISADAKWPVREIATPPATEKLKQAIEIHQQGQTDYPTICIQAAEAGVEKWIVDMIKMTCTYYDKAGGEMLVEPIPMV